MAQALPEPDAQVRGRLTRQAPLAPLVWFKSGGAAATLFEPADVADLQDFLRELDPATPVMALGLGSNLIVRDGGVPGVVVARCHRTDMFVRSLKSRPPRPTRSAVSCAWGRPPAPR